ncbi:hypothetical protein MHU86_18088 [Fragilaria crotonensis]|nr:hypothetical protein MHU86_18088 [Fragilaria crotonensis]
MPEPMIIESIEEEFVEESATNPILEALNELPKAAIQQPVRMLPHFFLNHPKAFESSCPSSPPPLCNVPGPSSPSIVGLDVLRSYAGRPTERTYHRHGFRQHDLYPKHLFQIAKDIKSTAAALSLFPDTTTFRTLPRFANHAFFEADLFPTFCIPYRGLKRYRKMFRVDLNFARANPYLVAYTNSFRLDDEEQRSIALRTAQTIIRLALFEHGLINRKTRRRSREPELSNNRFHIGNLPPADLFLSNFATCFPMITRPSLVQLDLDDVNDDTLAINYVVCQPLDFLQLFTLQPTEANETYYMDVYSDLTPVPTNGINFSIDFLPHFDKSRNLPTTFNHDQQPIISNRDGEPYNRLSVQALFKAQLAKPILSYHIGDPDWIPTSAANLRRHPDSSKYHVARDPKAVPFSLAIRMIPVFTTGPLEESIYQAWALPHLIDALRDPEIQLFNNHLSYYYNEKESHPEFPFIDQMGPDSPFSANGYNGESSLQCLSYPGCYAGYLPFSICDSLGCPNQMELVTSNNIITFQQDTTTFSGPHFACLAVKTRRSALFSDPTRTPDPQHEISAQNDPQNENLAANEPETTVFTHDEPDSENPTQSDTTSENPTQNDAHSTETHSQQLISDAETTYTITHKKLNNCPELNQISRFATKLARNKQFTHQNTL